MDRVIKLDNVDHYNSLYGLETLHPLVSVVDLTKATKSVNHIQIGQSYPNDLWPLCTLSERS